jgi:hypothetical protein
MESAMIMIRFAAIALLLAMTGTVCAADTRDVVRLSEPVEQTADSETFGAPLDTSVPIVALSEIAGDGDSYVGKSVRVTARVSQVCRKKGCFFIAQEGDAVIRVSFRDYGFFVPTDAGGKRVTFVGEVVAKVVTSEEAEHFADDLGDPRSTLQTGKTYEIVATSVRVPIERGG